MDGAAVEKDGKLHFNGTVKSEDEKNQIWNALKTVPDYQRDVVADIKVAPQARRLAPGAGAGAQATGAGGPDLHRPVRRHAERHCQAASRRRQQILKIFEANRDVLSDPDKIKPGQVLKIPS